MKRMICLLVIVFCLYLVCPASFLEAQTREPIHLGGGHINFIPTDTGKYVWPDDSKKMFNDFISKAYPLMEQVMSKPSDTIDVKVYSGFTGGGSYYYPDQAISVGAGWPADPTTNKDYWFRLFLIEASHAWKDGLWRLYHQDRNGDGVYDDLPAYIEVGSSRCVAYVLANYMKQQGLWNDFGAWGLNLGWNDILNDASKEALAGVKDEGRQGSPSEVSTWLNACLLDWTLLSFSQSNSTDLLGGMRFHAQLWEHMCEVINANQALFMEEEFIWAINDMSSTPIDGMRAGDWFKGRSMAYWYDLPPVSPPTPTVYSIPELTDNPRSSTARVYAQNKVFSLSEANARKEVRNPPYDPIAVGVSFNYRINPTYIYFFVTKRNEYVKLPLIDGYVNGKLVNCYGQLVMEQRFELSSHIQQFQLWKNDGYFTLLYPEGAYTFIAEFHINDNGQEKTYTRSNIIGVIPVSMFNYTIQDYPGFWILGSYPTANGLVAANSSFDVLVNYLAPGLARVAMSCGNNPCSVTVNGSEFTVPLPFSRAVAVPWRK